MNGYIRGLLAIFLLLPFQAGAADSQAPACVCTPGSFASRWTGADAVFIGTVEDVSIIEKFRAPNTMDLPAAVRLRIDDAYKNVKTGEDFLIHTSLTRETCLGHPFEAGGKYLVFAYQRKEGIYESWSLYNFSKGTYDVGGLCGGTKPFDDQATGADLRQIAAEIDRADAARSSGLPGMLNKFKKSSDNK